MSATIRIGIDVGGTFTDLFLLDETSGRTVRHKLPSTPADPDRAPIQGLQELLHKANVQPSRVRFVGLGTTVATNALLERRGAVTGLLTTAGFRDLLEIGRQRRPHAYDLFARKPSPLVPRELRREIPERVGPDGAIVAPMNEDGLAAILADFAARGVTSIAVCFINSYANPRHERRIAELIRRLAPKVAVTVSQDIVPEYREFERLSSTVANAYLMPAMQRYLESFARKVQDLGIPEPPLVMNSGGGVVAPALAGRRPIDMLLSGPSGGVSAARHLAESCARPDLITFDMGGTSTDVCLIERARAEVTHGRVIDGLSLRSTALDVHTVGAGGSSIAWIDAGGLLRVGPHSAGAQPGPACYGAAGAKPTITDANVVLGRLNPRFLLGGALPIDADAAAEAIRRDIAVPKKLAVNEAAAAMLAVANTNIAQAIRFVSVERGLDPAAFTLVAFGGAGPVHAAEVARELGMTVLVPPAPGVMCAMGVLTKDMQIDLSQTLLARGRSEDIAPRAAALFADLEQRAARTFGDAGIDAGGWVIERSVDARYAGQSFELEVPVVAGPVHADTLDAVRRDFDAHHRRRYGYDRPGSDIEFVTFRLRAGIPVPKPAFCAEAPGPGAELRPAGARSAWFDVADGFVECPVWNRADLGERSLVEGPAIIEQLDCTTVVPPDFSARADGLGNLILSRKGSDA